MKITPLERVKNAINCETELQKELYEMSGVYIRKFTEKEVNIEVKTRGNHRIMLLNEDHYGHICGYFNNTDISNYLFSYDVNGISISTIGRNNTNFYTTCYPSFKPHYAVIVRE